MYRLVANHSRSGNVKLLPAQDSVEKLLLCSGSNSSTIRKFVSFSAVVFQAHVFKAMNPFRTGQLVMFTVSYDRQWHFFEIFFYIILGIFGGLYGALVIKWNLRVQAFRKRYLGQYPILEATILAIATAILCYPNKFLRIDMTESMEILFLECEGGHDYDGLCE